MKVWEKYSSHKKKKGKSHLISAIENKINFNIPNDYNEYILNFSGFESQIGHEYVTIWDLNELMEFNIDYEVFKLVQNGIGIGSNGSSEIIVLKMQDNKQVKILLIPYFDLDEVKTYIEIGDSFTDLFIRLESGQNWFK